MDYEKKIDTIIESNEIYKLKSMLDDCTDPLNEKIINDIIVFKNHVKENKKTVIKSDINERLAKIDEYVYRRPWKKLHEIQKKTKLEEYLKNYLFNAPVENIKNIKEMIMDDFNKKKLNSAKNVTYDSTGAVILSINNLEYDNELCEYNYLGN